MQNAFIDNISQAGQQAWEAAREAGELNTSTFKTMLEKQLEMTRQLADINTRQARIVTEFKDAESAAQAQSELNREVAEQAAANAREAMALFNSTREAYDKLFQKGLKDAGETMDKARKAYDTAA